MEDTEITEKYSERFSSVCPVSSAVPFFVFLSSVLFAPLGLIAFDFLCELRALRGSA